MYLSTAGSGKHLNKLLRGMDFIPTWESRELVHRELPPWCRLRSYLSKGWRWWSLGTWLRYSSKKKIPRPLAEGGRAVCATLHCDSQKLIDVSVMNWVLGPFFLRCLWYSRQTSPSVWFLKTGMWLWLQGVLWYSFPYLKNFHAHSLAESRVENSQLDGCVSKWRGSQRKLPHWWRVRETLCVGNDSFFSLQTILLGP